MIRSRGGIGRLFWLAQPALWLACGCAPAVLCADEPVIGAGVASQSSSQSPPQFERDILPIFTAQCLKCHGLESRQANLDLRTVGLMLKGGETGPAIDMAAPNKSLLLAKVLERSMPPEKELPLNDEKIELIRRWVLAGAPAENPEATANAGEASSLSPGARDFWAFQRLARPQVPTSFPPDRVRTPIDAFVLAKLSERGLSLSTEAARQKLIRRVYLDLVGLLPPWDEVQKFVSDPSPDAMDRLVDGLLTSPHFGERWGRHWLDWCGYVDVIGDDTDRDITKISAGKWRYRDWVVRQLNDDRPLDRFIVEQIAGDELVDWRHASEFAPADQDLLVATGFLRTAPVETLQNELNTADIRHQVLAQTMEVTVNNLLGLTVHCARCHTHKYDPIPQEDYYRMLAFFTPAFNPEVWLQPAQRELADISPSQKAEFEQANADIDRQVGEISAQVQKLREPHRVRLFEEQLAKLPEPIRADTKAAIELPSDKRSEVQKYLADKFGGALTIAPEQITAALSPAEQQQADDLNKQIATLQGQKRTWGSLQTVYDVAAPTPTYLLRRGNHQTPGQEVPPAFLRVLCDSDAEAIAACTPPFEGASGRRLALAQWLTAPDTRANSLLARVIVNRVWQELMGRGIVTTSENFGQSGTRPTHPELLDWLAQQLIESGWQLKPVVRQIVLSNVYRQESSESQLAGASGEVPAPTIADPGNELWWRMPLRQLDAEVLRDAILCASAKLNPAMGGPSLALENRPDGAVVVKTEGLPAADSQYRRSLYLTARRRYNLSLLEIFDQPEMARNCARRSPSAVVTQSLALMHDGFLQEQSQFFADRVRRQSTADASPEHSELQIAAVFQIALGREPTNDERQAAQQLVERQSQRYLALQMSPDEAARRGLGHLCQMILASNEFLYAP